MRKYWYDHHANCYCDRCFKHKCIKKPKGKARKMSYFNYIKSTYWLKRKKDYYKTHKRQCKACGSFKQIDLHHMEYGSFGAEPDYALITLCRECHAEYHREYPMKHNMIKMSLLFIKRKQDTIKNICRNMDIV